MRKCKNVVFAGVLSPLSFAVERKGAVGDKNKEVAPESETSPTVEKTLAAQFSDTYGKALTLPSGETENRADFCS